MDGLFDTIAGLPMHPLLVHAPVVLLPLGALGLLLVLVRRAWRERYGFLVGAALVAGAGAAFAAAESGEALAKRVGVPADHSTWGDRLPLAAGALAVVALGWLLSTRRSAQSGLAKGLGALAAVLAVAVVALTALVGHSGASAAWKDRIAATPSSTGTAAGTASATASASGTATGSTAYSLAQVAEHATAQSCWAAVDAGNLAALPVLPGIETLTIGADNDPAGRQAARRCATRWARAGRAVYVVTAPGARADLNDLAQEVA